MNDVLIYLYVVLKVVFCVQSTVLYKNIIIMNYILFQNLNLILN